MALMQIYDGLENPPKLLERRSAQTVGELVRQADALSEKEHAQGYPRIPTSYITTMVREFIRGGEYLCKKN